MSRPNKTRIFSNLSKALIAHRKPQILLFLPHAKTTLESACVVTELRARRQFLQFLTVSATYHHISAFSAVSSCFTIVVTCIRHFSCRIVLGRASRGSLHRFCHFCK